MAGDEQARALLEEARPHIDPALYALLGLILDRQEALLFPSEAPTKPRPRPPLPPVLDPEAFPKAAKAFESAVEKLRERP